MIRDTFDGDTEHLRRSIAALLELDAAKALVPHGIGGHARTLLEAAYVRLAAPPSEEVVKALNLALEMLGRYEPGDSRAVSDEYVAMAAVAAGRADAKCVRVIDRALSALTVKPSPSLHGGEGG